MMSKLQDLERRVVHGKRGQGRGGRGEGGRGEEKKNKKTEEEDDLFIYLFTILVNLKMPSLTLSI
jgi:hypothetical protein